MAEYFNTSLRNLVYRLRRFKPVLEKELEGEILGKSFLVAQLMIAKGQLEEGLDGRGVPLASIHDYTKRSKDKKSKMGEYTGKVTLRNTGTFHRSLKVVSEAGGFRIVSTDNPRKVGHLIRRWGKPILRLSNEHLNELLMEIRPSLSAKLKRYIRGQFISEKAARAELDVI